MRADWKHERTDLRTRLDRAVQSLREKISRFGRASKKAIFCRWPILRLEKAFLRTRVDFRFQRADQGSKRADLRPYRTNRPEMAEGGTKKNYWIDGQTNARLCVVQDFAVHPLWQTFLPNLQIYLLKSKICLPRAHISPLSANQPSPHLSEASYAWYSTLKLS